MPSDQVIIMKRILLLLLVIAAVVGLTVSCYSPSRGSSTGQVSSPWLWTSWSNSWDSYGTNRAIVP